jgi:pyruvate kinase
VERRAKIVATLGPATREEAVVRSLLAAGADIVRLNLSHGTHDEHRAALRLVRRLAAEAGRPVAVVVDLMGPRYRLGEVPGRRRNLARGERVRLGAPEAGVDLPVDDPDFLRHVEPGERLLVDSGLVELRVEAEEGRVVTAEVVDGGPVASRKGLNLPDSQIPFTISEKDRADISFAVAEGADYLAASYVGEAADVEAVRAAAAACGERLPVIAKLERATALEHLEAITAAADGLMVARGDLGVEVPLATVPIHQKRIVALGRRAGKPVIVATQMLESMVEQPRPTRAEATDVANAVLDGADALMLSGETAAGRYPVEAVATMARIMLEAEAYERGRARERRTLAPLADFEARALAPEEGGGELSHDVPDVVSAAAVFAAEELRVRAIAAFSQSGFSARLAARYRPAAPIVAFTPDERVARRLQLVWGVRPLAAPVEVEHLDGLVREVDRGLLSSGLAAPGDRIIVLMGHPVRERPLTNLMRVHRVRSLAEWEKERPR